MGVVYSATLNATGGTGTITWALNTGALPAGLRSAANSAITSTPTAAGRKLHASGDGTPTRIGHGATLDRHRKRCRFPTGLRVRAGTFALPGGTVGVVYQCRR